MRLDITCCVAKSWTKPSRKRRAASLLPTLISRKMTSKLTSIPSCSLSSDKFLSKALSSCRAPHPQAFAIIIRIMRCTEGLYAVLRQKRKAPRRVPSKGRLPSCSACGLEANVNEGLLPYCSRYEQIDDPDDKSRQESSKYRDLHLRNDKLGSPDYHR